VSAAPERVPCPVCDGTGFEFLFERGGESFVRCHGCGLVMINPRPRRERVKAIYDQHYSHGYIIKSQAKLRRARRWVDRIRRRYVPSGRWLDIGCSAGFVVKAATEAGFDAHGIDPEAAAIRYAREVLGLANVACAKLEHCDYRNGTFDVITLYDVIEHVDDLDALVERLRRLLHPAGVIEIRTPDVGHLRVPAALWRWNEIKPAEHLHYFSRATLARLLARHGLEIVAQRRSLKPGLKVYVRHARA
jgi:2-polyprenyl-3-methyl-5-hydroxy-6-metoxy-1,4-benzoquinol methylase